MSESARPRASSSLARDAGVASAITAAVVLILLAARSQKVGLYLDVLEGTGLLYAIPLGALAAFLLLLSYPRLPLYALALLLPFNFVGGFWGDSAFVLMAKMAVTVAALASLVAALLASSRDRAWLTRTRLGAALLLWLTAVLIGAIIGYVNAPNRGYWLRETSWMVSYLCAIAFGTLLRGRRDIVRLLGCMCAGVGALQAYAFWVLVNGQRYARSDAWDAGGSFIRAPYSCQSLFVLYLAVAAFLYFASRRALNGPRSLALLTVIATLGGGLLASMGRALWLTGAIALTPVLWYIPWDRRTVRAAAAVAAGAALALAVVVAVDRLSPSTSGNWTGSAATFLIDLASNESTSRVTREMEWSNAVAVWGRSPIVGVGFGYAYPVITFGLPPEAEISEAFFIHNSYLNVLAKCGIFGLAALLYLLWVTFAAVRTFLHRWTDRPERILAIALMATLVHVVVFAAMVPVLSASDTVVYVSTIVGLVAALQRIDS